MSSYFVNALNCYQPGLETGEQPQNYSTSAHPNHAYNYSSSSGYQYSPSPPSQHVGQNGHYYPSSPTYSASPHPLTHKSAILSHNNQGRSGHIDNRAVYDDVTRNYNHQALDYRSLKTEIVHTDKSSDSPPLHSSQGPLTPGSGQPSSPPGDDGSDSGQSAGPSQIYPWMKRVHCGQGNVLFLI